MINPLIDKLPTKIKVGNEINAINADFRNCIKIILAYEDENLTLQEKHYIMIKRLYKTIPQNIEQAIIQGIRFLNCGEESKNTSSLRRTYSFDKDAKFIFSSVNQTHQIDLEKIDFFHWWKFCYFFMDVSKDCAFSNIISFRQRKNKGKLTKEEIKIYMESREILDLDYSGEQEESEFMKLFNEGVDETRNQTER